jgi:hypothetical protein
MQFDVYGKHIKVEHVKDLPNDGEFSHAKQTIKIKSDIKGKELIECYLHELFHAMCDRLGFENTGIVT